MLLLFGKFVDAYPVIDFSSFKDIRKKQCLQ